MLLTPRFGPAQRHAVTPAEAARFFAAVAENGAARRVLLLRPSRLPGWPVAGPEVARLRRALEPVLALPGLVWNDLPEGDHLAIWRRGGEAEVATLTAEAAATPGVAAVFDVPADLDALRLALAAIAAEHGEALPPTPEGPPPVPVTVEDIARIERVIGQVELIDRLTERPIWRLEGEGGKELAIRRFRLDLAQLLEALLPGRTLSPVPALRARFAALAHGRILAQAARLNDLAGAGTIMLPSDVAALLGPGFARFDEQLPGRLRGRIVFEIALADAVASAGRFTAAARVAAAAEVPVCLSGIAPAHLAALGPLADGATWLRVTRAEALASGAAAVPPALLPRVIAAGVATAAAVDGLRRRGIAMIAGPALDAA